MTARGRSSLDFTSLAERRRSILRVVCQAAIAAAALVIVMALLFEIQSVLAGNFRVVGVVVVSMTIELLTAGYALRLLSQGEAVRATHLMMPISTAVIFVNAFRYSGVTGLISSLLLLVLVIVGLISNARDIMRYSLITLAVFGLLGLLETFEVTKSLTIRQNELRGIIPITALLFAFAIGTVMVLMTMFSRALEQAAKQSEAWANDIMQVNEQLMEKNIQQIELGTALSSAAADLSSASQQQASGATQQASAVSEVSSTIEELGYTARQIASAADQVRDAAQQTLESLATGQQAVDEAIHGMERIKGRVQEVSTRVLSLGERSQQISEIIALIDDVSDETHLLALNAAIEAAGAGEHGRRFAVVAAEVKSLANRTLAAAREVKGVIAEIQTATNASVLATEDSVKEVEAGVDLAHRAGQVMDSIVVLGERTAQFAQEISLATAQQQTASEQVVETMRDIAEVSRQTASGSRQTAEAATTLTSIAGKLHSLVNIDANNP